MNIPLESLNQSVCQGMLIFCRLSALFMAAPIFGSQLIAVRIRIILAFLLSMVLISLLPATPTLEFFSIRMLLAVSQQILIGLSMGFFLHVVFHVTVYAGQVLAMQAGLGFATLVDPQNHQTLPMISQFYLMAVTLLFFAIDGHLIIIKMLVESFHLFPLLGNPISADVWYQMVLFAQKIFSGALSIALPAITALLLVNFLFAVMTKSAPQLNIFTIGFPITLIFGLILMCFNFPAMMNHTENLIQLSFHQLDSLLEVG